MFTSKNSKYFFVKSEFCGIISQNWWFSKDLWSPIILRSLTKYMIYNHSRSWSAKTGKIWSTITHDHDRIRSWSDMPNSWFWKGHICPESNQLKFSIPNIPKPLLWSPGVVEPHDTMGWPKIKNNMFLCTRFKYCN